MHCDEGINQGTGCLGRLWLFLLDRFDMPLVRHDEPDQHFALTAFSYTEPMGA
jgi:hypothetical protein